MTNPTLTRRELVDLAFDVLSEDDNVSKSDKRHLLYAATTMEQVAAGGWIIDDQCGCLVGTMLLNEGHKANEIHDDSLIMDLERKVADASNGSALRELGCEFDDALVTKLGSKALAGDYPDLDTDSYEELIKEIEERSYYGPVDIID